MKTIELLAKSSGSLVRFRQVVFSGCNLQPPAAILRGWGGQEQLFSMILAEGGRSLA